jgi:hypothetical protein
MPRLCTAIAIAVAALLAAPGYSTSASAQQQKASAGPQYAQHRNKAGRRPQVIIRDRDREMYGPPLPPSSTQRNYYGPAPGIQPPMERVPLPAPLAPPPIR